MFSELRARLARRPGRRLNAYAVRFRRRVIDGKTYFLPRYALHRPACRELLAGRLYEPETHATVAKLLSERGGDIVHAGTFFGDMLPSFAAACRGTVYAFEPVLENYVLAKLCVEENGLANVSLFNAALGERRGSVCIDVGTVLHRGGSSRLAATGQQTTMMTVDQLGLDDLSVLQLDVEGAELAALKGAVETIKRSAPVIMVEDNSANCAPFLGSLGYDHDRDIPGLQIWVKR